MDRLRYI
jgi:hypothetical protein